MKHSSKYSYLLEIFLAGILFLVFFQLLTDFIAGIYAFGLLGTSLPIELVAVLLLFAPVLIWIGGRALRGKALVVAGELALICRVIEPLLDTRLRMLVSGLGVALLLVFLVSLLWNKGAGLLQWSGSTLGMGLALGVGWAVMLRAVNSSVDISLDGIHLWSGWLLAVIAALLLAVLLPTGLQPPLTAQRTPAKRWKVVGLCLGWMGVLVLFYYAFISPGVIARWTGANYLLVLSLAAGSLALFSILLVLRSAWFTRASPLVLLAWNLAFVIVLVLTILPYQLIFPSDPSGYPFYDPGVNSLTVVPLILMLLLYPVLIVDFIHLTRALVDSGASARLMGGGFSLASLYLLLMVFAHVFTTTYDYIPLVGSYFRNQFWLIYLVAGLVPTLAVLLTGRKKEKGAEEAPPPAAFAWAVVILAAAAIAGAFQTAAKPTGQAMTAGGLKVMTYNIQQGYSDAGTKNFDGQLDVIQQFGPDILGLQESDTNRIANGNADIVRYFADGLGMYSYFGPSTVTGTFGIALLSRYPIEEPRTFYMFSEGEQTAAIEARITVGGKPYRVVVTHLGNSGPIVQQEALLEAVGQAENLIAMGDFNFRPDTEQYRLTTSTLVDAWRLRWPSGVDDQGIDPARRIDHIFLSPGIEVEDIRYLNSPESDHPAVIAIVR
jgi:endonuclease/exonuclease/phosphatase family metal-dependent hydrolase